MQETSKIRFVLIGGFLGAGKTTLIGQLARRYIAAGKRVGIITNDQAENLVDTQNFRSQGFQVGEVAGACFCCSFDDLVSTADKLSAEGAPDVLLAEPVGSCTDLIATVVLPLQQLLGDRFELAPFGVLLKPSHGKRILTGDSEKSRSGFSPQAEYIFRKQLEEADYLMIGRRDQLSDQEMTSLKKALNVVARDVPILAVSPTTGEGVDEVLGYIESPMVAGRHLLELDYDTYADGEAELGWVNLTANLQSDQEIELDRLAAQLVRRICDDAVRHHQGKIAHLKAAVLSADTQAIASMVSNDSDVDVGLKSGRSVAGAIQVILNAHLAMDPSVLEQCCRRGVEAVAREAGLVVQSVDAKSLRPGYPTPTHRVTPT